ncbi:MAG: SDR family NAD(P)-dependent oxidoreductase [Gammaproteobacteria bacterium]
MGLLNDKVTLITGAARGIGAACALRFALEGAKVVLLDNRSEGLDVCSKIGPPAKFIRCDVRDDYALHEAFAKTVEIFGQIDVVIANAGFNGTRAPIEEFPLGDFDELISTNLRSAFLTLRNAVPHMKERGGSIVLMGSVNGTRRFSHAGSSIYCVTKAAISAMAKSLSPELGRYGIRINAVCPGHIRTKINETLKVINIDHLNIELSMPKGSPALGGGVANPDEVADACLFLASELSRHISGIELFVDGGQSLIA